MHDDRFLVLHGQFQLCLKHFTLHTLGRVLVVVIETSFANCYNRRVGERAFDGAQRVGRPRRRLVWVDSGGGRESVCRRQLDRVSCRRFAIRYDDDMADTACSCALDDVLPIIVEASKGRR